MTKIDSALMYKSEHVVTIKLYILAWIFQLSGDVERRFCTRNRSVSFTKDFDSEQRKGGWKDEDLKRII